MSLRITKQNASVPLTFTLDGETVHAFTHETIAVAMLAIGRRCLRTTSRMKASRGVFCNMGVCFECLVEVDRRESVRACRTMVRQDMQVRTQRGLATSAIPPETPR